MIQLQWLSKILQDKSLDIIERNYISYDYFYEYAEEFKFVQDHVREYGNVPDKATFLAKFPDIELVEVTETERYLVDTLKEEYLYQQSIPVLQKTAELLKTDSNAAAEYLASQVSVLQPQRGLGGTNIITQAQKRLEQYKERKENQSKFFFEINCLFER